MSRLATRLVALILLACLCLAGCRREVVAPGDPVAAVKGMAAAVRDNDLVRYSRLSMPPGLHQQMEARWHANLALAAPPTAEQEREYARWMARMTSADAETKLYRSFDRRLRKLESEINSQWPLMKATGGIFINGLIQANDDLSPAQKGHAKAVGTALLGWTTPALLADRVRARKAIAVVASTARSLDLDTLQQSRALEMIPALEKGGQVLKGVKQIGAHLWPGSGRVPGGRGGQGGRGRGRGGDAGSQLSAAGPHREVQPGPDSPGRPLVQRRRRSQRRSRIGPPARCRPPAERAMTEQPELPLPPPVPPRGRSRPRRRRPGRWPSRPGGRD